MQKKECKKGCFKKEVVRCLLFTTFAVPHQAEDVLNVVVDATNPDTHLDHHSPFRKVPKEYTVSTQN